MLSSIRFFVISFIAAGALAASAGGCELLSSVDRSQIGTSTSSGAGGATTSASTSTTTSTGTTGGGGTGGCSSVTDCPDPGTACVIASCNMGACATTNAAAGTACTGGGKVCDGNGACVACLASTDCTSPDVCDQSTHQCVAASCADGMKDGSETDKDCGGSCAACANGLTCAGAADCQSAYCKSGTCSPCAANGDCSAGSWCDPATGGGTCVPAKANGATCSAGAECSSTSCTDGVCCGAASCPTCQACNVSGKEGTCNDIAANMPDNNPPNACAGGNLCDGNGACVKPLGASCAQDGDCQGGHCVDSVCCGAASCPTCQACAAGTGMCGNIAAGQPDNVPANTCAGNDVCDGNGKCLAVGGAACAMGTDCLSGSCAASNTCQCSSAFPACLAGTACNTANNKCQ